MLKSLVVRKDGARQRCGLEVFDDLSGLPAGDVLMEVFFSTVNYKNALAVTGQGPVIRRFPMVPGIDFAGIVSESDDHRYEVGRPIILTGWGVGESHWGGFSQYARVLGDWLLPLSKSMSLRDSMALGAAGFTAMLCIIALERQGIAPGNGPTAVTGATGGVGSYAIALLARLGYEVSAISSKSTEAQYLKNLGANEFVECQELNPESRSSAKKQWAGAIDTVGDSVLANICAATRYKGVIADCGMAGGLTLSGSIAPFIIRGVTLTGVDSVQCNLQDRSEAWGRLTDLIDAELLTKIAPSEVGLAEVPIVAERLMSGKMTGRMVVNVSA